MSTATESNIIPPTVGRKVWFYPGNTRGDMIVMPSNGVPQPLDATIVYVSNDRCVNLLVADHGGKLHALTSIHLVQPGDPLHDGGYAMWMPYQVGQAKKHAAAPAEPSTSMEFRALPTGSEFTIADGGPVFIKTCGHLGLPPGADNAMDRKGHCYSFGLIEQVIPVHTKKLSGQATEGSQPSLDQAIAQDYGVSAVAMRREEESAKNRHASAFVDVVASSGAQGEQGEAPPTPLEAAASKVKSTVAALNAAQDKFARLERELENARQEKRCCTSDHEHAVRVLTKLAGSEVAILS